MMGVEYVVARLSAWEKVRKSCGCGQCSLCKTADHVLKELKAIVGDSFVDANEKKVEA